MAEQSFKAFFEPSLSHALKTETGIEKTRADLLFRFFQGHSLFRWTDANNDCEDRANAICLLLDKWNIPNYKAWAFSGFFLRKEQGSLVNFWNYHVAALLPVYENGQLEFYVIDPATLNQLSTIETWADNITSIANCYYVVTPGDTYIFRVGQIKKDRWFKRNRQNFKWTIQGLAGINGASKKGQAQLFFCRQRIRKAAQEFKILLENKPF